jgi:dihydroflavonol-4-reductase
MTQTILVTGASGYIAKHIVADLLNAGFTVRGTLRRLDRSDEVRAAVAPATGAGALDRLSFVALDLTADTGWAEAMAGVDAVLHTASPFPLVQPKDEAALIDPAVDGALRALRAAKAAGVPRVVLTASVAGVMGGAAVGRGRPAGGATWTEADWTDTADAAVTAYAKSKTLAERAAWDYVAKEAPQIALTTINPALVIGPPLDVHYGTSIRVVERIVKAADPMVPNVGFCLVDVRDVARMHVAALGLPATEGQRIIASDRFMWFGDMAQVLKAGLPGRKIVTRKAPDLMIRALGLFDPSVRTILPSLGRRDVFSGDLAKGLFGVGFRDTRESLVETARFLIDSGRV